MAPTEEQMPTNPDGRAGHTPAPAAVRPPDLAGPLGKGCPIRLTVFEGPLDLLLHLIRENELEITDLPVAQVAD